MIYGKELPKIAGEVDRFEVEFSFSIKGKARPKFNGITGTAYMPKSYCTNKEAIKWMLREAQRNQGKHYFLSAQHFYVQRVISYRKLRKPKSKADGEWMKDHMPEGEWCFGCSGYADLDNFIGTLMDASQGILYPSDRQVVASVEDRVWADHWGAFYTVAKVESPEWPNPR